MKTYLVTGAAGFIGFHVSRALLERGDRVLGLDNLNDYYDVSLKKARLRLLQDNEDFNFYKEDLANREGLSRIFGQNKIQVVCNMAAQAGVRYSLENPFAYQSSNVEGFLNIIHLSQEHKVENFVYASSSSVYGSNEKVPFSVRDRVDNPISLYAATKKANELIAHTYSHLYSLPCSGLRLFTVYGPWGRPDMALFIFTKAITKNQPIEVYNFGKMRRDFTYIDDIVQGVLASMDRPVPYAIYNLGNSRAVDLLYFIECIEKELGKKAEKKLLPMQPGDVVETYADISESERDLGFHPTTRIEEGIASFINWYRSFYGEEND
ncbi:MAG: NAD-dependent epimerase [Deltaproteobacteria bacterium]|nr:MAG: NAD-dependent epimerase [Deltaproteobacteria bacterium]